jgi:AraC family transcriptional activator of tynA and feaB
MSQTISTDVLPAGERFEFWREIVTKRHIRFAVEQLDNQSPFRAQLTGLVLGDVLMSLESLTGVHGSRTIQDVSLDGMDHYLLCFPSIKSTQPAQIKQGGQTRTVNARDIFLLDAAQPFQYWHRDMEDAMTVAIPRYHLEQRLRQSEVRGFRISPANHGLGRLLFSYCREIPLLLQDGVADSAVLNTLSEHLISLTALAFESSSDGLEQAQDTLVSLRLKSVFNCIDSNLHRSDLSAEWVARETGLSRSGLFQLLKSHDVRFQSYVTERRLESAARDLSNPALSHFSVSEVAYQNGFNNLSHFSHRFSRRYGMSPRAYRVEGKG